MVRARWLATEIGRMPGVQAPIPGHPGRLRPGPGYDMAGGWPGGVPPLTLAWCWGGAPLGMYAAGMCADDCWCKPGGACPECGSKNLSEGECSILFCLDCDWTEGY
jgi:hypothetical protein